MIRDPQSMPASAPATALDTVVIITDPDAVEIVDFVPEPASAEEIEAAVLGLTESMPGTLESLLGPGVAQFLSVDADATLIMTTEERAEATEQDGFADYLSSHGHDFSAMTTVVNSNCDLETLPLAGMTYVIDIYATPEDAAAAIGDPILEELQLAQGYELLETGLDYPVYSDTTSVCDTDDLVKVRAFEQAGRFVMRAEVVFVDGTVAATRGESAEILIEGFSTIIFKAALDDIIRPELARQ